MMLNRKMPMAVGAVLSLFVVAGCVNKDTAIAFDGQYFRVKMAKVDKQRDQFTATVGRASASIDGAKEAGRYEATRYCIENYGSSSITWVVGPDSPNDALRLEGDKLILRGACVQ